jgi:hypothetical protein
VLVATIVAAVVSVALYWGHFGEVYSAQVARMRASPSGSVGDARPREPATQAETAPGAGEPMLGRDTIPLRGRAVSALGQTLANIGWPILVLAAVGAWRVIAERRRDPLVRAVLAWGTVCVAFVAFSVLSASDRRYQQDAWEFIGRVEHATYAAAVVLAGYGAAWGWRRSATTSATTTVAVAAAAILAARAWLGWILGSG